MALVVERPLKTDDVFLVLWVIGGNVLQDLDFLDTSHSHCLIVTHDFDGHGLASVSISGSDNRGEHSSTKILSHMVTILNQLTKDSDVVPFRIVPVIHQGDVQGLSSLGLCPYLHRGFCKHVIIVFVGKHVK